MCVAFAGWLGRGVSRLRSRCRSRRLAAGALRHGVILLAEGSALAFTPPLTITAEQLEHALGVVDSLVAEVAP